MRVEEPPVADNCKLAARCGAMYCTTDCPEAQQQPPDAALQATWEMQL